MADEAPDFFQPATTSWKIEVFLIATEIRYAQFIAWLDVLGRMECPGSTRALLVNIGVARVVEVGGRRVYAIAHILLAVLATTANTEGVVIISSNKIETEVGCQVWHETERHDRRELEESHAAVFELLVGVVRGVVHGKAEQAGSCFGCSSMVE